MAEEESSQSKRLSRQENRATSPNSDDAIMSQIQITNEWKAYFKFWFYLHYGLGALGIILSALIASKPTWFGFKEDPYAALACVLAISTSLFTFLKPNERGTRYRRAWSILNSAITRYRAKKSSIDDVLAAYDQGEAIIHEDTPASQPTNRLT